MNCKQCGKTIKDKETACPSCGAPVEAQQVSLGASHKAHTRHSKKKKLTPEEKGLRITLIVVAVLAVLAILLGLGYSILVGMVKESLA